MRNVRHSARSVLVYAMIIAFAAAGVQVYAQAPTPGDDLTPEQRLDISNDIFNQMDQVENSGGAPAETTTATTDDSDSGGGGGNGTSTALIVGGVVVVAAVAGYFIYRHYRNTHSQKEASSTPHVAEYILSENLSITLDQPLLTAEDQAIDLSELTTADLESGSVSLNYRF